MRKEKISSIRVRFGLESLFGVWLKQKSNALNSRELVLEEKTERN